MGQRAHRIQKIVYAEGIFFIPGTPLGDAVINHSDANDQRNQDGGGIVEIPLAGLIDILEHAEEMGLSPEDCKELEAEIEELEKAGKEKDEYILYDIF